MHETVKNLCNMINNVPNVNIDIFHRMKTEVDEFNKLCIKELFTLVMFHEISVCHSRIDPLT